MKRGSYKTEAVVLNSYDYGESDAILALYTRDYGKVKGIAKGGRRSKRRFVGTLDHGTFIRLDFFANGRSELVRLENSSLVDAFPSIKNDLHTLAHASFFLELVNETTKEGQVSRKVFSLLTGSLSLLARGGEAATLTRCFEIKLLELLGFMPHIEGCVSCLKGVQKLGSLTIFFSPSRGGLVCRECAASSGYGAGGGFVPLSMGTARFLSNAASFDINKLTRLNPGSVILDESERALQAFIGYLTGREFNSQRFLRSLNNSPFASFNARLNAAVSWKA